MVRTVEEVQKKKRELGVPVDKKVQPPPEQRKQEAREFIGERERLANTLGVSSRRAGEILARQEPETPESVAERTVAEEKAAVRQPRASKSPHTPRVSRQSYRGGSPGSTDTG